MSSPIMEPVPPDERAVLFSEVEQAAGLGCYVWEPGRRIAWSDGMLRVLGLPIGDPFPVAEAFFALVHPGDRARVEAAWRNAATNGAVPSIIYRIVRPDGSTRYIRGEGTVGVNAAGDGPRIVGTLLDVTETQEATLKLKRLHDLLSSTQMAAGVGSYVFDYDARILVWSEEMCRMLGVPPDFSPKQEDTAKFIHPEDRPIQAEWGRRVAAGETLPPLHVRVVRTDGEVRHVESRAQRIDDADGGSRLLGVLIDITSRVELETKLRHSAKMEAVGTLAAGVAHDFNNYLTVVTLQLEALQHAVPSLGHGLVREAQEATKRCAALTRQLLAFANKQPTVPRVLDLSVVAQSALRLFAHLAGASIEVALDLPPEPVLVQADASLIESCLMNLAVNARDAMPAGGLLEVTVREETLAADDARLEHGFAPGCYARLAVRDTGHGIPKERLPRIFEPYFSTKDKGKGTGLGLASVYGTVRQHKGFVRVASKLGRGTLFEIFLPGSGVNPLDGAAAGAAYRARAEPSPGFARILIVDDMAALRESTQGVLRRAGYDVMLAEDGRHALRLLDATLEPVDLVLTDLMMPNMGGIELAARLPQAAPRAEVMFMTGYADGSALEEIEARWPSKVVLHKPFLSTDLLRAVSEALAPVRSRQTT